MSNDEKDHRYFFGVSNNPLEEKKGVYGIVNLHTGDIYIGSTATSFKKRFGEHRTRLNTNSGKPNRHLQFAWNKYGEDAFELIALYESLHWETPKQIREVEQWYIDTWNPEYNIATNVEKTFLGRKHSEEAKRKVGDANRGKARSEEYKERLRSMNSGKNNPFYGKKHSKETISKLSGTNRSYAKLDPAKVRAMRVMRVTKGYSYEKIGGIFGVTHRTASRAISGETWKHVK